MTLKINYFSALSSDDLYLLHPYAMGRVGKGRRIINYACALNLHTYGKKLWIIL